MKRLLTCKRFFAFVACMALLLSGGGLTAFAAETDATWEMTVPQIRVTTENGNGTALQKEDGYQNAQITITDTDGSVLTNNCQLKVRGNTTALSWIEKKAFTVKFDKKTDVLGMGKGKKWALVANAFDPTLLRNYMAFSLAKKLGLAYTSEFRFTELWVDGVFRGCYFLTEPVQEGKDRVDIDIERNDGKNDFLIEYEARRQEDDVTYFIVQGLRFIASEPEEPDEAQLDYIQSTMDEIISAIRRGNPEEIAEKIDVPSFAKFYLLNEFLKTFDFDMSSVFFYYQNGKLYAGPVWDYDLSAGNTNPDYLPRGLEAHSPENVHANKNIYRYLAGQDWFVDAVRSVYRAHYGDFSAVSADGGMLDSAYAQYGDVFSRNYREAGWYVGMWWINIQMKPLLTYDKNYAYLKDWCRQRNTWMTGYYKPFAKGDADGDGTVTVNDVTVMQRFLAETEQELPLPAADVNGDGTVTVEDATLIQRLLAEFEAELS